MDPASAAAPAPETAVTDAPPPAADPPAPAADTPPGDPAATPPAGDPPADDKTPADPPAAAAPEAKKGPNLTARLAEMSREKRELERQARQAAKERDEAQSRAKDLDTILERAKTDNTVIPMLFEKAGLDFKRVVDFYAADGAEKTPDQLQQEALASLKGEVDALKKQRDKEAAEAKQRADQAAIQEQVAGIAQVIAKGGEKFEICARLGDEAARDVHKLVVETWVKIGSPDLMPGEYDEAVLAAIETKELEYEERGKKLAKATKSGTPATPAAEGAQAPAQGAPTNGAHKNPTGLPDGLTAATSKLSDKDEDIVKGLIDRTAPGNSSQRAKPRTINSQLGGSAPPKAPARADMDPREALRAITAQFLPRQ